MTIEFEDMMALSAAFFAGMMVRPVYIIAKKEKKKRKSAPKRDRKGRFKKAR